MNVQLIRNGLYNNLGWAASVVGAFLVTPLMVFRLGMEGYGIYVVLISWQAYSAVLDLGLGQALTRAIAGHRARREDSRAFATLRTVLIVHALIGLAGASLLLARPDTVLGFLRVPERLIRDSREALIFAAAIFAVSMVHGTLKSCLQGLQRYDITGLIAMSAQCYLTAALLVATMTRAGLKEMVILCGSAELLSASAAAFALTRLLRGALRQEEFAPEEAGRESLAPFATYVFVAQVADFLVQQGVRLVLAANVGLAAVTLLAVPMKLINLLGGMLAASFGALVPYASELEARGEKRDIARLYRHSLRTFVAFCFPFILFLTGFSRPVLSVWMGAEFAAEGWKVCSALALACGLGSLTTVPSLLMLGLGRARERCWLAVLSGSVLVACLTTLTPRLGVYGALIALGAAAVAGQSFLFYATPRLAGVGAVSVYRETLGPHVVPAILAGVMTWLCGVRGELQGVGWVLLAIVWLGIYVWIIISRRVIEIGDGGLRGLLTQLSWISTGSGKGGTGV